MIRPKFLVFILAVVCLAVTQSAMSVPISSCEGEAQFDGRYCRMEVEGWTVFFESRLLRDRPQTAVAALHVMRTKLLEIASALPPQRIAELRRVAIWLELKAPDGGRFHYHPAGSTWPRDHGFPEAKIGSVDIGDAERFVQDNSQPSALLHELAHAYHNQVLGFRNNIILRAFKHAVDSGLYRDVKRNTGRVGPAYALTNEREYFAELTEAYFGRNDFFPFVRAELEAYDPVGFEAVRTAWEVYPFQIERREAGCQSSPGGAACCPAERELRSRDTREAVRLVVRNDSTRPIKMIWLDFQGARKPYADVPAGALHVQETYLAHPWLLTDIEGQCLAVVFPERNGSAVRFGE